MTGKYSRKMNWQFLSMFYILKMKKYVLPVLKLTSEPEKQIPIEISVSEKWY